MSAAAKGGESRAEVIDFSDAARAAEELGAFQESCEVASSEMVAGAVAVRFLARSGRFGKAGTLAACAAEFVLVDGTRVRASRASEASDRVGTPIAIVYRTPEATIDWPERQVAEVRLQVPGTRKTFRFRNVFAE